MRILYIVTAYPRRSGEVITPWLGETIERLRSRGTEVEVLAPSYRGLGDQVVDGTPVHRFRYAPKRIETLTHDQSAPDRIRERPVYAGLLPGYVVAGAIAAARLGASRRFDLVHSFWPLPHTIFGLAAGRAGRIPLVSTFFGVELSWLRSQLPFLRPVVRSLIRRSDAVTVISRHTAREVQRLVPEVALKTIPFGAAVDPRPAAAGAVIPEDRDAGGFQLLFIGRLVERKGVEILLRAVARLRAEPHLRLTIVGDGPLRGPLESLAAELSLGERVEFTGFVPADELRGWLERCDVLVLPAVEDSKGDVEGLGVVLIEALLHARPVIASDCGGITDIVVDGETGLLVPPGDDQALAMAIRRVAGDPELALRLARQGREYVAERFSWDHIIGQLMDLYGSLTPHPDRSGSRHSAGPVV